MASNFESLCLEVSELLTRLQAAHEQEVTGARLDPLCTPKISVLRSDTLPSLSFEPDLPVDSRTQTPHDLDDLPRTITSQSPQSESGCGSAPTLDDVQGLVIDAYAQAPHVGVPAPHVEDPAWHSSDCLDGMPKMMMKRAGSMDSLDSAARSSQLSTRLYKKEREHRAFQQNQQEVRPILTRSLIAKAVDSLTFEVLIGAMIFGNCVLVGIEVQSFAETHSLRPPGYIDVMGYMIYIVFFVELVLRVTSHGPRHFFCQRESVGWSWFDAVVVATSTVDLLLTALVNSSASSTSVSNVRIFRLIKLARLMRIVRAARILRYVSALRMLIYSITVSLKSVMWALLLFLLIIYIFGIVFTQEMVQSIVDCGDADVTDDDPRLLYWSSIYSAMFTLFKSICGGVTWQDAAEPLRERHVLLAFLFAVYIWFTYFVVLNVITGAFCSSASAAAANDPDMIAMGIEVNKNKRERHARRVFKAIDLDNSGYLTISELKERISDSDVQGLLLAIGIEVDDAMTLFTVMDADNSGHIDVEEFVSSCMALRGSVSNVDFVRATAETRLMMRRLVKITRTLENLAPSPGHTRTLENIAPSPGHQRLSTSHLAIAPDGFEEMASLDECSPPKSSDHVALVRV